MQPNFANYFSTRMFGMLVCSGRTEAHVPVKLLLPSVGNLLNGMKGSL